MSARPYDSNANLLVDLPNMIQSVAAQRRTGVLTLTHGDGDRRQLAFQGGQLIALGGPTPGFFAKSVVWAQVLPPDQLTQCLNTLGKNVTHVEIADHLVDRKLTTRDGLLDAIDCYIEEAFADAVAWVTPAIDFSAVIPDDPWIAFQMKMGVTINPGSLLLEGLRRVDEMVAIKPLMPDPWDVLILDRAKPLPADLSEDARLVVSGWRDGIIANVLIDRSLLPPFRASAALAQLRRLGLVRSATAEELVVYADAAHSHGRQRDAYGLYRRALVMGLDSPRLHLHIAELAERFGENAVAATSYVNAATALKDPGHAVVLLRNALALTTDRLPALTALLVIYLQLGEKEDSRDLLIEIARLREAQGDLEKAVQAVKQALELGADKVSCASTLARLSAAAGDLDQAALHYELAAHAAQFANRNDEALAAWRALVALKPEHQEYAREFADLLIALDQNDEALTVVREAVRQGGSGGDDVLIPLYEMLARLDPENTSVHDWLARSYTRRRDRDGAVAQLLVVADRQDKDGDPNALAATLERIVDMGSAKPEVWARLARTRARLRQSGLAAAAWCSAIDACLALGNIPQAVDILGEALDGHQTSLPLRVRQAQVASRANHEAAAISAFRIAKDLARGAGEPAVARDMLQHLARLCPDDLIVRIELAEAAHETRDANLDLFYREVVRCAVRSGNHGFAVDFARRRMGTAQGVDALTARSELVELLRRTGDTAGELAEGKILLDLLLEHGAFEQAVQLLSRLVASHNRNADLVLQLADLYQAIDDERQSQRFYRHAVVLLQVDGHLDEARRILDQLQGQFPDDLSLALARQRIDAGQAVDWDALHQEIAADERRRLAGSMGVPTTPVPANG